MTFSFAEVVALISLGLFVSLFNCSHQRIAKSYTQKFPFGKEFGYVVPECAFRKAYAISGTCLQEGATHFSGHIYVSAHLNFNGTH